MDFITFNIIIDDIVFPDGRTSMGLLGGSGPQTALAMRLWHDRVGLVAGVGRDLPEAAMRWLDDMAIDTAGLQVSPDLPTPRAWQVLEHDGRRTQIWRVPGPVIGQQLGRNLDRMPASYRQAKGAHLGIHPDSPNLDFIRALRSMGMTVSLETFRPTDQPVSDEALQMLAGAGQIFSPNLHEAQSMLGIDDPLAIIDRLAEAGAELVTLRQGEAGVTVHRRDTGETWTIPALEVEVVDPVGAGNAFCGGFLAGWVKGQDLLTAGLYGIVSASFLVEAEGVPTPPLAGLIAEAEQRLARAKATARQIR